MAVNVEPTRIASDLSIIVNGSINAVKKTRSTEQARKEAEFQRAIANGMSYEDQVAFREKQLKEETDSSFADIDYISKLEKSVADTKKLSRFNRYRTRYAELVTELSAGKINEQSYLESLKQNLNGVNDEDLRLEIQNDIVTATQKVKEYQDTILGNQVKKAKYDGTQSALNDAISRVNSARMQAVISENDDEVSAYDETLAALQGQLSTTKIQDSITDFQVRSITRGVNPTEKLNFINNEIQKADPNVEVKIGDRTYANAQQFWTLERDNFLAGNSQVFGDFFSELKATAKNAVDANAAKFGYPTQVVLDQTLSYFNDLRAKPEIAPFIGKLDITQATVMAEAVDKLAKTVNDIATNNLSFKEVDALQRKGYIVGRLERVQFAAPGIKETNWDATPVVQGVDGVQRRWIYLHYFKSNPSCVALIEFNQRSLRYEIKMIIQSRRRG